MTRKQCGNVSLDWCPLTGTRRDVVAAPHRRIEFPVGIASDGGRSCPLAVRLSPGIENVCSSPGRRATTVHAQ